MRTIRIYLTDLKTGDRKTFPMLPSSIDMEDAAKFWSYDLIELGDIQFPRGEALTRISWDGMLPAAIRKNEPYIARYQNPKGFQEWLLNAKSQKKKLRLLVTDTPINFDVYIESYHATFEGMGDYHYSISFVQAKTLGIKTETNSALSTSPAKSDRPVAAKGGSYTVVKGDCLWSIAQKKMGAGNKYPQLYEANKSVIDPRNQKYQMPRYTIYPGQVLTIPQ